MLKPSLQDIVNSLRTQLIYPFMFGVIKSDDAKAEQAFSKFTNSEDKNELIASLNLMDCICLIKYCRNKKEFGNERLLTALVDRAVTLLPPSAQAQAYSNELTALTQNSNPITQRVTSIEELNTLEVLPKLAALDKVITQHCKEQIPFSLTYNAEPDGSFQFFDTLPQALISLIPDKFFQENMRPILEAFRGDQKHTISISYMLQYHDIALCRFSFYQAESWIEHDIELGALAINLLHQGKINIDVFLKVNDESVDIVHKLQFLEVLYDNGDKNIKVRVNEWALKLVEAETRKGSANAMITIDGQQRYLLGFYLEHAIKLKNSQLCKLIVEPALKNHQTNIAASKKQSQPESSWFYSIYSTFSKSNPDPNAAFKNPSQDEIRRIIAADKNPTSDSAFTVELFGGLFKRAYFTSPQYLILGQSDVDEAVALYTFAPTDANLRALDKFLDDLQANKMVHVNLLCARDGEDRGQFLEKINGYKTSITNFKTLVITTAVQFAIDTKNVDLAGILCTQAQKTAARDAVNAILDKAPDFKERLRHTFTDAVSKPAHQSISKPADKPAAAQQVKGFGF
jgi:hypothetical protein